MSEEQKYKRVYVFAVIAILLALIAYSSAQIVNSNVFEIIVDNTDLYPASRLPGVNYINTDYPIALTVIFHVLGTGASQTVDTNLTVNGTVVIDTDYRTTSGAGLHEHFTTYFIIPRNSTYSITNSSNVHDIEWREYPILSGSNDTIGINQSNIYYYNNTSGTNNHANLTNLNWSVAGHIIDTTLDMQNNSILNYNVTASGYYTGDGTTNRSITYNLSGRTATKIDIISSYETGNYIGAIIQPGYIYDVPNRSRINVSSHTDSYFYVSDNFNIFSGIRTFEIGDMSASAGSLSGYIRYFPITVNVTGTTINISINSQTAAGSVRMAIYSDSAGSPLTLLNQTGSTVLVNGWTNISLITPVSSNTYWIATQYNNDSEQVYYKGSGTMKYQAQAYGTFPATAGGLSTAAVTHNEKLTVIADTATYYWVAI